MRRQNVSENIKKKKKKKRRKDDRKSSIRVSENGIIRVFTTIINMFKKKTENSVNNWKLRKK